MFASVDPCPTADLGLVQRLCRALRDYSVQIEERDESFDEDVFGEIWIDGDDPDVRLI
jgi:hypothetical protein